MPAQQWPALCELVESIRSGRQSLFEPAPELLHAAQQIADRLSLSALPDSTSDDLAQVHRDSLDHRLVRSVGAERLALRELRFAETLRELGVSSRDARIAAALVLARMLHPSSEREAHAWLSRHSAALFRRERSLLERPPTIAFYDLTNVHYHGRTCATAAPRRNATTVPWAHSG